MDPGSAGSHRTFDEAGSSDGGIPARSAAVPDVDCFESDGLHGGDIDNSVDVVGALDILQAEGKRGGSRWCQGEVPGARE